MNMGDSLTHHGIITGAEKDMFVLTIHHSIYDGLSQHDVQRSPPDGLGRACAGSRSVPRLRPPCHEEEH